MKAMMPITLNVQPLLLRKMALAANASETVCSRRLRVLCIFHNDEYFAYAARWNQLMQRSVNQSQSGQKPMKRMVERASEEVPVAT